MGVVRLRRSKRPSITSSWAAGCTTTRSGSASGRPRGIASTAFAASLPRASRSRATASSPSSISGPASSMRASRWGTPTRWSRPFEKSRGSTPDRKWPSALLALDGHSLLTCTARASLSQLDQPHRELHMQKYILVTAHNPTDLERQVNACIADGYRPLGGAFAFKEGLAQTLFRSPL